jgi:ferredoxin
VVTPTSENGAADQRFSGSLQALERVTDVLERPVRAVSGSHRLNPLPHAGTITVFLLGVVIASGLYITLFFEFGYAASYRSVEAMNGHGIQKVMRALHRYSSAVLVLTTVVHAWRILVAQRFTGRQRRWRWVSGVSSLLIVWLAGVTGYWLVWDIRAQALSETVNSLFGRFGWGAGLMVRSLSGTDGGSGSGLLLVLWFAHLGLTAMVCYFVWRHVRRTRLAILPPRQWMLIMSGALLLVSLAVPLEMLAPATPSSLPVDMPLDPFVLFLLPPLLSDAAWVWVVAGLVVLAFVVLLPWLLTRRDPGVVAIDDRACTGCDLCVVDCPYEALRLVDRVDAQPLAVVDPATCVGCGICIGSCAFGAMALPGMPEMAPAQVPELGQAVVVACDRHDLSALPPDALVRSVRCTGMINPLALADDYRAGAESIQIIGCAPGECRFGVGNRQTAERLAGDRAPHLPRKYSGQVSEDWVALGEAARAAAEPGAHPDADNRTLPFAREKYIGAALVVAVSVVAVAAATRAPFHPADDRAEVRVVVDHAAGRPLVTDPDRPLSEIEGIAVEIEGEVVTADVVRWGDAAVGVIDVDVEPGAGPIEVRAIVEGEEVPVNVTVESVTAGERALIQLRDVPRPVVAADGERVFNARASGCAVCHSVVPGDDGVGPSLGSIAGVAGDRVPGLDAENYLRQSILLPDQYVLEGWPAGQMSPFYRDTLSEEDLNALIAYLLTLEGVSS